MTLKSTFGKLKKTKLGSKIKKPRPIKDLVTGGVTALLGIALLSETSNLVSKI